MDAFFSGISIACGLYLIGSITLRISEAVGRWWDIRHPDPATDPVYLGHHIVNVKLHGTIGRDERGEPQ